MKRILATMLCLATASVAVADDWNFFTTVGEENSLEVAAYDRDAIIKHDGDINVWVAWINSTPSKKHDLMLDLWQINCDQKKYKRLQTSLYVRGKQLYSTHKEGAWKCAIPGTAGEIAIEVSCVRFESVEKIKTRSLVELVKKGKELIKEQASQKENDF